MDLFFRRLRRDYNDGVLLVLDRRLGLEADLYLDAAQFALFVRQSGAG